MMPSTTKIHRVVGAAVVETVKVVDYFWPKLPLQIGWLTFSFYTNYLLAVGVISGRRSGVGLALCSRHAGSYAATPKHTRPIDPCDLVRDTLPTPVIVDRLTTPADRVVIVYDRISAHRHLRIEGRQCLPCRLVHVAVEPKDSNTLDRRRGERVAEPAFQEPDPVIE